MELLQGDVPRPVASGGTGNDRYHVTYLSETDAFQKIKVSVNKPALNKVKEYSSSDESSDEEEEEKPKPVVKPTVKQKATESSSGKNFLVFVL